MKLKNKLLREVNDELWKMFVEICSLKKKKITNEIEDMIKERYPICKLEEKTK